MTSPTAHPWPPNGAGIEAVHVRPKRPARPDPDDAGDRTGIGIDGTMYDGMTNRTHVRIRENALVKSVRAKGFPTTGALH